MRIIVDDLAKEGKELGTKGYNFFLGRISFTDDDGSQNMFVYQPTFTTMKQVNNNVSIWKSKWKYNNLNSYTILRPHNIFQEVSFKNWTCCNFDDIIKIEDLTLIIF